MFRYVRLQDSSPLPEVSDLKPFKAVVILESEVTPVWQNLVSIWLVKSGCLYMMAWGDDCGSWDDSVDWASMEMFDYGDIPEDQFVMTTWHDDETLSEVFDFSKRHALHSTVDLDNVLIVHIGTDDKRAEFSELFERT